MRSVLLKAALVAAAAAVASAQEGAQTTGGAGAQPQVSYILPLAPAAYGGPGVINPYSNVNPLNPMAAQMQQQALGQANSVPQTLMGPSYSATRPVNPGQQSFLESEGRAVPLDYRALFEQHADHARLSHGENSPDHAVPAMPPRFAELLAQEELAAAVAAGAGGCQGCVYGGVLSGASGLPPAGMVVAGTIPRRHPSCGCAETAQACSCSTLVVPAVIHRGNTTLAAPALLEAEARAAALAREAAEAGAECTYTVTVQCVRCVPCPPQYVEPEYLPLHAGERISACQCASDDADCQCRLRAQREADAAEAARSKFVQPEFLPDRGCEATQSCKKINVVPEFKPCDKGCPRSEVTGLCSCETVAPEIAPEPAPCACHAEPVCPCRGVVVATSVPASASAAAAPKTCGCHAEPVCPCREMVAPEITN